MKSSEIDRIIRSDRKARELLAAAERYRAESAETLEEKKERIRLKVAEDTQSEANAAMERGRRAADAEVGEKKRRAEAAAAAMDARYREMKDTWVKEYTRRIVGLPTE